jgi:hypothetical protein
MPRAEWLLAVAVLAGGCTARALVPNQNDAYREQIRALESKVAGLERANQELLATLAARERRDEVPAEVLANAPSAVRLALGWGSGLDRPGSRTGEPNGSTLRSMTLYIEPRDARDRFVQVTGWLDVSVVTLPEGGAAPVAVGNVQLGPAALRDGFRGGAFGSHYTVTAPITLPPGPVAPSLLAQVTFRDGFSGKTLSAALTIPLRGPERSP